MNISFKDMETVLMRELRLYHHPIAVRLLPTEDALNHLPSFPVLAEYFCPDLTSSPPRSSPSASGKSPRAWLARLL